MSTNVPAYPNISIVPFFLKHALHLHLSQTDLPLITATEGESSITTMSCIYRNVVTTESCPIVSCLLKEVILEAASILHNRNIVLSLCVS